jgi:hypothetical protein
LISLTGGDIRSAAQAAVSLYIAIGRVAHGTATIADGETIGDDLLTGLAIADPAAAPWIALVKVLIACGVIGVENGWVKPDPDPEVDAQNETGR